MEELPVDTFFLIDEVSSLPAALLLNSMQRMISCHPSCSEDTRLVQQLGNADCCH